MKNYGPEKNAKFPFFAEKAIFRYLAFECCGDHNFSSRITKLCVHSLNTYTYPQQKKGFALAQSGRWQFQFEVWADFPQDI